MDMEKLKWHFLKNHLLFCIAGELISNVTLFVCIYVALSINVYWFIFHDLRVNFSEKHKDKKKKLATFC